MSALDDQVRETVNRVLESIRDRLESELGSCQDELVRAAQEATRALRRSGRERHGRGASVTLSGRSPRLRESAARDAEEQRAQLSAEIEDLQRRLSETREERQRLIEEHERRIEESQLQIEAAGRDTDTARSEAESARQRADAAREEADAASLELESARQQLDATREDVEATLRDIEAARRDSAAARGELQQLSEALRLRDERARQAARLPDAVRALDEAATFGEVLESLVQAGREAGRAAVFLVKGDRLRDWRTIGFDFASDAPRLDIGLSESGPMAEAVRSGQSVRVRGEHPLPDFARNEEAREAAAWPISVGGSVVAVLYADGPVADKPDEPYWPAFLDVLAMHAGRVLEGITVRQAAGLMTGRIDWHFAVLVSGSSVLREHSVRKCVLVVVCAVAALHGLGAQQTGDGTRAREAAAVPARGDAARAAAVRSLAGTGSSRTCPARPRRGPAGFRRLREIRQRRARDCRRGLCGGIVARSTDWI